MPVLPMFPLGTVLLPGDALPLHVFEPRYRRLVRDCLADPDGPRFGVVLIERGHEVGGGETRHDVGTIARIVMDTELDDGRYVLECIGEERIRVKNWLPDDPYPRAEVEPWPDTVSGPVDFAELSVGLGRLYGLLDRLSNGRIEPPSITELPDEPGARLFALARFVPIGEADRLQVLTAPGPAERSAVVTECISNAVQLAQWRLDSM
ncbi:LON peptidase substrate-binding domain-containing protein [Rhodococcus ruber]|uniref:LON peptidase substrate-binding domain-containing protein n=1 Tax=Rhodococcus ruber TaxID=1830 RepID=UPI003D8185FD